MPVGAPVSRRHVFVIYLVGRKETAAVKVLGVDPMVGTNRSHCLVNAAVKGRCLFSR